MSNDKKVFSPIKLVDYRVVRPVVFLEKGGNTVVQVQQLSTFSINSCQVSFTTPNAITLFYNKSRKEYEQALMIYERVIREKISGKESYDVSMDDLPSIFDYLEHIQTSIITIYSAIEALCNVAIPVDFTLTKKNGKGITEVWDKANIEKWSSTEEKVGKIVPDLLHIDSPKSLSLWPIFKELKTIRDNIIHQKQSVSKPNEVESDFLTALLEESIFKKILSGFELIEYFCSKDQTHTYFPMLSAEIPVNVNMVDSFAGTFAISKKVNEIKDLNA